MTHEEAISLLPVYALGALDRDVAAFEAHLDHCDRCQAELANYLETTATLGEAVESARPPRALREAVLTLVPEREISPRRRLFRLALPTRFPLAFAAVAALLAVALGLAAWSVTQQRQLQTARSELALDARGLDLLTSTETLVARLEPVAQPGSPAHGHWYHRLGIPTQVLVVEFMPALRSGEAYFGWLQYEDGSWRPAGEFALDDKGYGRLILLDDDGSRVRGVSITSQTRTTAQPEGEVVLRWP